MNETENYIVDCNCGKAYHVSGYCLGVVVNSKGIAKKKYRNTPDLICPNCGLVSPFSYANIGPVISDQEAVSASELIPVPAEWLKVKTK